MFLEELKDILDDLVIEDSASVFDSDEYVFEFLATTQLVKATEKD